ncbi:CBL-interacting serine/threonine-protein kinase 26 [Platanthera guangdongensis]|uniref:CBL-interacting serine/threonine-protein kinase 26 n=1 Tax=Platanthera guangdongensis TaxID=2320717 RepID=A0ABR2LKQ7_9ASPA
MGHEIEKRFPASAKDYQLFEEVGEGVSATVYRALCIPLNEEVAIKVLDLERCNNDLDDIKREVQTMRIINHPNVVQAYCSFPAGQKLWIVMPYMAGGSCLHIMKYAHPDGFEEPVIATVLYEILKALIYLHSEGHIHRDVKYMTNTSKHTVLTELSPPVLAFSEVHELLPEIPKLDSGIGKHRKVSEINKYYLSSDISLTSNRLGRRTAAPGSVGERSRRRRYLTLGAARGGRPLLDAAGGCSWCNTVRWR